MRHARYFVPLMTALWLSACSTPPSAVQASAEETDAWMGKLQAELSNFSREMEAADQVLLKAIRNSQKDAADLTTSHAELIRVARASGDERTLELMTRLKTVIEGAASDPTDLRLRLNEIDERMAGMLSPYPVTDFSFTQARTAVRLVGQPLPDRVQFNELKALFKQIKEDTDANRKQLHGAVAPATPAASAAQP